MSAVIAVAGAVAATATLAVAALKRVPDFDQDKLKELEKELDLLNHAIKHEDSDLILSAKSKIETMSTAYRELL